MQFSIGPGEAVTLLLAGVATVVWLVRLEGKVKEAQTKQSADLEVINVKLGNLQTQHDKFERDTQERVKELHRVIGRAKVWTDDADSD